MAAITYPTSPVPVGADRVQRLDPYTWTAPAPGQSLNAFYPLFKALPSTSTGTTPPSYYWS